MKNKHLYCSVDVAAFNLGMNRTSLYKWLKNNEVTRQGTDIDFTEILFMRREQAEQQKNDISDSAKKLAAEVKIKEAKAKQEAIKVAELEGKIIYADDVNSFLAELFTNIRQEILAIPNELQSQVSFFAPNVAGECRQVAEEIIHKLLKRLADQEYNTKA